jgi:hypothetical protein
LGDKVVVYDQPLLAGNIFIFNTRRNRSTTCACAKP